MKNKNVKIKAAWLWCSVWTCGVKLRLTWSRAPVSESCGGCGGLVLGSEQSFKKGRKERPGEGGRAGRDGEGRWGRLGSAMPKQLQSRDDDDDGAVAVAVVAVVGVMAPRPLCHTAPSQVQGGACWPPTGRERRRRRRASVQNNNMKSTHFSIQSSRQLCVYKMCNNKNIIEKGLWSITFHLYGDFLLICRTFLFNFFIYTSCKPQGTGAKHENLEWNHFFFCFNKDFYPCKTKQKKIKSRTATNDCFHYWGICRLFSFWLIDLCPKVKYTQFTGIRWKEMQQNVTMKKLKN